MREDGKRIPQNCGPQSSLADSNIFEYPFLYFHFELWKRVRVFNAAWKPIVVSRTMIPETLTTEG